jgi:CheY-like chemotaxis protein
MSGDVLIIEADESVAGQIADAVGRRGFSPRVTGDGKDGYDLAQAARPAAIVLCAELPKVSGYSICAKLKKDPALKDVPLIFTSAEASESTFEHHKKLKVRADEYLSKPFAMPQLLELLGRHVPLSADAGDDAPTRDEISISEDIAIEAEPELVDAEPEAGAVGFGPLGGEVRGESEGIATATDSTDVAFDAALEAIAEQPDFEAMPAVEAPPPPPPPPSPPPSVDASLAPTSPPAPANGAPVESRAPSLRTGDLERAAGSSGASQRALLELKKELNAKNRELFELKDQLHAKDRELLELRDRETDLESRIVQVEEEHEALEGRLREAESRRDALEGARAEVEQRVREAEQRAHTLRSELEQATSEREALESARAAAESEAAHSRAELESVRRESEEAKQALETAEARRQQLERRAREAEDAAAKARSALESGLDILRRLETETDA